MKRAAKVLLLFAIVLVPSSPQTESTDLQALAEVASRLALDIQRQNAPLKFGLGLQVANDTVSVNEAWVAIRGVVPRQPGPCDLGTGMWSTTTTHLYLCVPDGTGRGFRWARVALEQKW